MDCWILSCHYQDVDSWKCWVSVFFADLTIFFNFYPQHLTISNRKAYHFWKELSKISHMHLPKSRLFSAAISRKYNKSAILDILMTITLEVNMITGQMTFCISRPTLKIKFHEVPLLHYVLVCKIHISCQRLYL